MAVKKLYTKTNQRYQKYHRTKAKKANFSNAKLLKQMCSFLR